MLSFKGSIIITVLLVVNAETDLLQVHENHISTIKNSLTNSRISAECLQQLKFYFEGLVNKELWAWQSK